MHNYRCLPLPVLLALLSLLGAGPASAQNVRRLEGVLNLNTANADQLRLLPGIGPAKVRNVIAYRRAHPFRTVDELVRIKGIGRKMVRHLRMHLAVSGPTTAQQVIRPASDPVPIVAGPPPPMIAAPPVPPRPAGITPRPTVIPRRVLSHVVFPTANANDCTRGP